MKNNNPNEKESISQNKAILEYLQNGGSITSLSALKMFGCLRLSSRIWDLKNSGHIIKKEWIKLENGKRVIKFSL